MVTSKEYLKDRLYSGKGKGYSHMVVVCDSWDYTDFVVYVKESENFDDRLKKYRGLETLYRIMEIYNYSMDLDYQLNEYRAFHEKVEDIIPKGVERLEKLPSFVDEDSLGTVKIKSL